ncbi:MAG: DNA polymerase I [Clostridiales Family XIII bacterium]|jgi:DNA polymerase-1|nr:DNA polymerase I [Clostridiales Family XIII bacterium]
MENRIVIIDGNSLVNRAYYAIQRPMITREGIYTQGIYGFLTMYEKIMRDYAPGYVTVAFDRKAPTFRHEEYKEYKAGRKKMPDELVMQLPLLKEVLDAFHVKCLELDGFEADDIIGTVAKKAEEHGLEPLIITGDKDALQLATEKTKILITKKGISEFEIYDAAAMVEKYGFTPQEFIDFKGLMGDPSDNIPGVPGVGEKTALTLIRTFQNIENLLNHLDSVPGDKLRAKLEENADLARMSRRLAEINVFTPVETDFETYKVEPPDWARLTALYTKLEFNNFLKKLKLPAGALSSNPSSIAGEGAVPPAGGAGEERRKILDAAKRAYQEKKQALASVTVRTDADRARLEKAAAEAEYAVLRVFGNPNHVGRPLVYGISILLTNTCFYLPMEGGGGSGGVNAASLEKLLRTLKKGVAGHNLQADFYLLGSMGAEGEIQIRFDTAIGQYLLDPVRSDYPLGLLTLEYLQEDFAQAKAAGEAQQLDMLSDPDTENAEYGCAYCCAVDALIAPIQAELAADGLENVFENAELPLIPVLSKLEIAGFSVDREELSRVGKALSENVDALTRQIYASAGESFNIKSPAQLGVILFEKLGLASSKKTKIGYATGADILEKLRDKHEIIDLILEYRMLTKLTGTYVEGLLPLIGKDGRIHAHFQQTVTATGRISCTEPNLQNIPIKQEPGRTIRRAFVPENEDFLLVSADYSQIELRVLAHLAQDAALLEDFRQGADIHRRTAARVFGLAEDEVTSLQRSRAKAVNFGIIYGMSGFGLSEELRITRKEAERYIDDYFRVHGAVREYMDEQIRFCRETGYVKTVLGRRRRIPEIAAAGYMARQLGERLAMNTPIQGSAADIIKLAMIRVDRVLRAENLRSRLILQVHDELIIEACREELDQVEQLLRENMEQAFPLSVPLTVDLNIGASWHALK